MTTENQNNLRSKRPNLVWPITVIVASLILGGAIYLTQLSKQGSIERQQQSETDEKTQLQTSQYRACVAESFNKQQDEFGGIGGCFENDDPKPCVDTLTKQWDDKAKAECIQKYPYAEIE